MKRIIESLYTIAVLLSPALAVYEFLPGTPLGAFVLLMFSLLYFLSHGLTTLSRDNFFLFAVVCGLTIVEMICNLFSGSLWFDYSLMAHNLYGISLCFFPLVVASKGVNVKLLIRGLFLLGALASVVIIWQRVTLILTGSFEANVFLPWFEIRRSISSFSISRPCAFFTEPAHFCIFMLPILYVALLCRNYIYLGFFIFAVFCSGSTTGFLAVIILVAYYVFQNSVARNRWRNFAMIIMISAILFLLILVYIPSIILQNVDKLQEVDSNSTTLRTVGYLSYFINFDLFEALFGVTLNQLANYLHYKFGINEVYNYSNAIIYMLLSYGILGALYFVWYLRRLWVNTCSSKGFVIVFIAILASDQILFNMHFLYLATLAMMSDKISCCLNKNTNMSRFLPFLSKL